MRDAELLADWIAKLAADLRAEIADLDAEALTWQPDAEGNSIGVTVWHVSRWLGVLTIQILQDRPAADEFWHTGGWATKTGYDPRGIGGRGLGNVTGYTLAEVAAIPTLSAADHLAYLDTVCAALRGQLLALPPDALADPTPGFNGKYSRYAWLKTLLPGCFGHVGEIQALKSLRARALVPQEA
jgi:hypothetical protein